MLWSHEGNLFHYATDETPQDKTKDNEAYRLILVNDIIKPQAYGLNY